MKIFLKVRRVDMDGYCGREPHPVREMEGLEVLVLASEISSHDGDDLTPEEANTRDPEHETDGWCTVYHCSVPDDPRWDGGVYVFIDHEVEFSRVEP